MGEAFSLIQAFVMVTAVVLGLSVATTWPGWLTGSLLGKQGRARIFWPTQNAARRWVLFLLASAGMWAFVLVAIPQTSRDEVRWWALAPAFLLWVTACLIAQQIGSASGHKWWMRRKQWEYMATTPPSYMH